MDPNDDLWTAIRRVMPDAEELSRRAAELGEPLDDVRLSVLIGTVAFNGQLGTEAAAAAAIEAELDRLQQVMARGRQVALSRSTRSPNSWPKRRRSRPRVRWTSRRSWRSSALRERLRHGPTDPWSSCSIAMRSPGA